MGVRYTARSLQTIWGNCESRCGEGTTEHVNLDRTLITHALLVMIALLRATRGACNPYKYARLVFFWTTTKNEWSEQTAI